MNNHIIKSSPLKNGIYTFSVLNVAASYSTYDNFTYVDRIISYSGAPISMTISSQGDKYLYSYPLTNDSLITMYVHNEYLFLKLIEGDKVKSTTSMTLETDLYNICICSLLQLNTSYDCSFCIHNHVQ